MSLLNFRFPKTQELLSLYKHFEKAKIKSLPKPFICMLKEALKDSYEGKMKFLTG